MRQVGARSRRPPSLPRTTRLGANSRAPHEALRPNHYARRQEQLSWAVEGAKRLLKNGDYTIPQASHDAVAEWMNDSNNVVQYADERLVILAEVNGQGLAGSAIYDDYKLRVREVNPSSTPLSRDRFLRRLRSWLQSKGADKHHSNGGNRYPVRFKGSGGGGPGSEHDYDFSNMLEAV